MEPAERRFICLARPVVELAVPPSVGPPSKFNMIIRKATPLAEQTSGQWFLCRRLLACSLGLLFGVLLFGSGGDGPTRLEEHEEDDQNDDGTSISPSSWPG